MHLMMKLAKQRIFFQIMLKIVQILQEVTKKKSMRWVIVGDNNYGEGSSREHAAMTPRFFRMCCCNCKNLLHEYMKTNLKKTRYSCINV